MQLFSLQSTIPYGDGQDFEQDVPDDMKELFNVRSQLSVSGGLLMYADRIVVPTSLRSEMLDRIHQCHQGITKCLDRIKISVWWPEITRDVKRTVAACEHCQTFKPSQPKEPLLTTPLPSRPGNRPISLRRTELPCHSRLLLSVDRSIAHKEYHNSSVRGQDEGRLRFSRRNCVRQRSAICVVGIPVVC